MNIKQLSDLYTTLSHKEASFDDRTRAEIHEVFRELSESSEKVQDLLLSRTSEKDLVRALAVIQKVVVSIACVEGDTPLLLAEMSGDLKGYTHSVVFAAIGLLIDEEIL